MINQLINIPSNPPYLFRAASDQSRGINTLDEIDPLDGYDSEYHAELAELEASNLHRTMIYDHIHFQDQSPSEFSSWSVSLLYGLVHAVPKTYSEDETNVVVYILDTKKLPASRIHSARDLLRSNGLKWWEKGRDLAHGEHLIHGRLCNTEGLWRAVRLESLISAGFWKVFPRLRDWGKEHLLLKRVNQLRGVLQRCLADGRWDPQNSPQRSGVFRRRMGWSDDGRTRRYPGS